MREQLKDNKILLHSCCGICSAYSIQRLKDLGYEPVVYFYNPNIYPEMEYKKRLEAQKAVCLYNNCKLITEKYQPEEFTVLAKGLENEPEKGIRCKKCFKLRLKRTAQKANELGIKSFTTTMTISPHKSFETILKVGLKVEKVYDIKYLAEDFKKKDGFLKTNRLSKELGLYRQNYCGCEYSKRREGNGM